MRQWIAVVVALMCIVPGAVAPAMGQTTSLIGGGLTALPTTSVVLVSSRDATDYGSLIESSGARGFVPKAELSGAAVLALIA